jgi:seryl-tRNA(Sec) selenium transferase
MQEKHKFSQETIRRTALWDSFIEKFKEQASRLKSPVKASILALKIFDEIKVDFNESHTRQFATVWPKKVRQKLVDVIVGNENFIITVKQQKALLASKEKEKAICTKAVDRNGNKEATERKRLPMLKAKRFSGRPSQPSDSALQKIRQIKKLT